MRRTLSLTLGILLACATIATASNNKKKKENTKEGYVFTELKRLPNTSVKSQDRAGTCWSWSTVSFQIGRAHV